ncbi:MAG: aminopeptidase [Planctomycetota bacterium]|jgi:aminopeptidase
MSAKISRKDLETWADYLLDYSLDGIGPDDVVMLKGEPVTWPLISVLQDKVFAAGGVADVNLVAPDNDRGKVWGASIARHGTVEQIVRVPAWHQGRYEAMNKYVEVLGAESPELFDGLPEETSKALARADEPYKKIRVAKDWVLTLYPTQGFADLEGMSLDEYTDVIVKASTVDPRLLDEIEQPIHEIMDKSERIRIVTQHPKNGRTLELTIGIGGRNIVKCTGKRNFPDGEVFTSPDARTPEGEIFVDMPVFQGGTVIQGVYLRFEGGVIREYTADQGHDALAKVIETDEGSHRLGEVALGMNGGIAKVLRHPLFVEKTGGTLHIAIGNSYHECYVESPTSEEGKAEIERLTGEGIVNKSAQHVDIVTDFRPGLGGAGREVWLDDTRLEVRDNVWILPGTR